jgi:hypothetical protein
MRPVRGVSRRTSRLSQRRGRSSHGEIERGRGLRLPEISPATPSDAAPPSTPPSTVVASYPTFRSLTHPTNVYPGRYCLPGYTQKWRRLSRPWGPLPDSLAIRVGRGNGCGFVKGADRSVGGRGRGRPRRRRWSSANRRLHQARRFSLESTFRLPRPSARRPTVARDAA